MAIWDCQKFLLMGPERQSGQRSFQCDIVFLLLGKKLAGLLFECADGRGVQLDILLFWSHAMRKVDLYLVGASKCGTTAMDCYLSPRPDATLTRICFNV